MIIKKALLDLQQAQERQQRHDLYNETINKLNKQIETEREAERDANSKLITNAITHVENVFNKGGKIVQTSIDQAITQIGTPTLIGPEQEITRKTFLEYFKKNK